MKPLGPVKHSTLLLQNRVGSRAPGPERQEGWSLGSPDPQPQPSPPEQQLQGSREASSNLPGQTLYFRDHKGRREETPIKPRRAKGPVSAPRVPSISSLSARTEGWTEHRTTPTATPQAPSMSTFPAYLQVAPSGPRCPRCAFQELLSQAAAACFQEPGEQSINYEMFLLKGKQDSKPMDPADLTTREQNTRA